MLVILSSDLSTAIFYLGDHVLYPMWTGHPYGKVILWMLDILNIYLSTALYTSVTIFFILCKQDIFTSRCYCGCWLKWLVIKVPLIIPRWRCSPSYVNRTSICQGTTGDAGYTDKLTKYRSLYLVDHVLYLMWTGHLYVKLIVWMLVILRSFRSTSDNTSVTMCFILCEQDIHMSRRYVRCWLYWQVI